MAVELEDWLEFTVENNASDLHLSSGLPPMIRIDGEMRRLSAAALSSSQILKMIYGIMNDSLINLVKRKVIDSNIALPLTLMRDKDMLRRVSGQSKG